MSWRCCLVGVVWLTLAFASSSAAQTDTRQVLILNSPNYDPFTFHTQMFRNELSRRSPAPINFLQASSQPPVPLPAGAQRDPVVEYLKAALAGQQLDLVVAVGGPAAVFAQQQRDLLFPTTPLVYTAVESRFLNDTPLTVHETAVAATLDLPRIIDNILVLLPETTSVFIVIGASQLEQFWRQELGREFQRFKGRLTFVWSNELSLAEILERASTLPPRSAIFFPILAIDGKGVLQSQDQALAQLRAVANAPIFGIYDFQVGRGIVGGPLMSMTDAARRAADAAGRVLRGESPDAIKTPIQGHSAPTYDWRELRRWGISEARLPAESTVLFQQPGVWEQYRGYILGATLIVGLQTALIAGLVVHRARRRRAEVELRRSYEQNQDLAGRLINAQEEERTRIARDLHDDLSQQLAGFSIMLSGLKQKALRRDAAVDLEGGLTTLQDRASTLAETVRNLSHELHPSVLEHAGLVATLRRHCAEVSQHHHLDVTVSTGDHLDSLTPDLSLCLFRVAQEALTNAVRHARARTIRVQSRASNDRVELSVVDDGIGFLASERSGSGLGLRSIDERVRLAGGTVTIESRPGQGTTVLVRVPRAIAETEVV